MKTYRARQRFYGCAKLFGAVLVFLTILYGYTDDLRAADADSFLRQTIKAHTGRVVAVDISPDGKLIVSGGDDGKIGIWNVADGKQTHKFGEYKEVNDVSFAPDEKRIVCAALDSRKKNVIDIWDYEDEKVREEITGHSQRINAVAYSPNGRMIASGSNDNTLRTWYAGNGREIHVYEAKKNDFLVVRWSPDNDHVAGGLSWDGKILVWDSSRDELELSLAGHSDWVKAVLFSPDGSNVISGGKDGSIRIWDFETGKEKMMSREGWWGEVYDLAISGDGLYLAGATGSGAVVVWYTTSGKILAVFEGHSGPVESVSFSKDGRIMVSGGSDGEIMIWAAPDSGGPEAWLALAARHDHGDNRIKKDPAEAFKWYLKAAEAGNSRAMARVGEMYGSGEGTATNEQEAIKWLKAAADRDDVEAMFALGNIYAEGRGVAADPEKAAELWAKAAAKGYAKAAAKLTAKADSVNVKAIEKNSLAWLEQAAGIGDIKAMFDLASVYEKGSGGVEKNGALALKWFSEAAKKGHVEAQYHLGNIYATGSGVARSEKEALLWYKKAADQGHRDALYMLGVSYLEGSGVKTDPKEAASLLRKAADKGRFDAKYRLGILYSTGVGVGRDYGKAVNLWKEAAEKGDAMAMFFLGYMYETGSGVKRDQGLAKKYYREAAGKGNAFARQAEE